MVTENTPTQVEYTYSEGSSIKTTKDSDILPTSQECHVWYLTKEGDLDIKSSRTQVQDVSLSMNTVFDIKSIDCQRPYVHTFSLSLEVKWLWNSMSINEHMKSYGD